MTRPLNLTVPVRCAKCPAKFTRAHGRERLCPACRRPDVRARNAARSSAAAAAARAAAESGADCQYPACGHRLAERAVDLAAGTCRPRGQSSAQDT